MNQLFEVTFSVGNTTDLRWLTTQISAFSYQQAEAMVRAQYGTQTEIHSCYLKT